MSEAHIERTFRTENDLFEIASYIATDKPDAAIRFLDAAESTFKILASMPEMGRPRRFSNPKLSGIRSFRVDGFENFLIFYRPLSDGIEVIRVLHGARDLDTALEE